MLNDKQSENTIRINRIFHVLMYILLLNLILDGIITFANVFTISNYLSELLTFGIQNILLFSVLMIFVLIMSIIPVIAGQNYKNWSEDKQTKVFFKLLTILSLTSITIVSIIIYLTLYLSYPILTNSYSMLSPFYQIWWYFSFNLGPILIFLLYIYLES